MSKEEKLKAIYEEIADKELKFGCKIKVYGDNYENGSRILTFRKISPLGGESSDEERYSFIEYNISCSPGICEIIGHPVMIGDVLDWVEGREIPKEIIGKYTTFQNFLYGLLGYWEKLRKPIDDNPEAIDFIYSLIQKGTKNND